MRRTLSRLVAAVVQLVFLTAFLLVPAFAQRHEREGDQPAARAAWFAAPRQAPPGGQPRAWYYMRAWKHAQKMPRLTPGRPLRGAGSASTLPGNWTEMGPKPENSGQYGAVAGRVTAIAVDTVKDPSGNTVYLGTAYGGLWESTNALSATPTFKPIGDSMPTLAVGAIALDASTTPTTIYIGTGESNGSLDSYYGVGILKSTDGGATWKSVTSDTLSDSFFGLTWSRILVDPGNPQIVLAAASYSGTYLGEGGSSGKFGLFISTDGGASFAPKLTGPPCTDLAYDSKTHTYYAAFAANGIWASSDQGVTWTQVSSPFANAVKPTGKNFARASLAARNGVVTVLIAGPDDKPSTPTVCPASPTSTTVCDTGLAQSSDGGKAWTPIAIPGTAPSTSTDSLFCADAKHCQGNYDQYVAMPPGGTDLIIGGIDTYQLSGGSGLTATWTNLTQSYGNGTVHPDEHAFASTADGSHWFIGNDGGIWSSGDKGGHWSNLNSSLGVIQFISVSADDGQTGVYFGGSQDNGTAKSDPSQGLLWNLIWGGDGGYTFDNPAQPQQYFTENPGFDIVSSNDGGQSFNTDVVDNSTIQDPTEFYVPYALSPDFSRMYVATNRVWAGPAQPASPGQGWTAISSDLTGSNCLQNGATPILTAIAVAPSDPNTVYVGANTGALAITSNANAAQPSWIHSNNPWCLSIGAIAIDPTHPKIAYAVTQDFYYQNSDRVMVTRDGGETWQDMTGKLPNVPINSVAVDPAMPEDVFIGTDTGVFATSDGGTQVSQTTAWEPLGTGLPAAAVLQVKVAQENGASVLVAATHGRGAWTIPAVAPPNFALETDQANYLAPVTSSQFQFPLHVKLINGSTAAVQLSCSVQNTSASCSLSQAQVSASGDVTVTVNLGANPSGEYPVQITGQDGTHQKSLAVAIDASDFQPGVSVGNGINLEFGASVNIPVTIGSTYGWTGPVALSCPNLPAGFTCSFAPASFPSLPAGGATSTLTLAATAGATATSPMQLSIAATSGQLTRTGTAPINLAHFHLTLGTMQETLVAGATSFTTTVTAQSASSSTQAITLSCNRLDTAPSQCSFNPATIQPGQTSTMTVSGLDTTIPGYVARFQLTVSGTAGSDNFVSDPLVVTVQDFNFTGDTPGRPLVAGADTYTGSFSYTSNNGYSTPLSLSCTADHGVQCATSPSSVSGTGTANFTLSGLSAVAAGTTVNVTFTASNSDMTRQMPSAFEVEDFQVQSELPVIGIMPGQGKGSASITINTTGSTSFSLGQFTVACAPGLPVSCSATSTGSNTANVAIDATQYLANGGKLPVNIQLTGSITQDGTTITHNLTLPVQSADFSMTGPTDPVTVTAGKTANFTIQFNTDNAFLADVAVQCTGAPAGASCKATSAPSSVPGSTSFQVTTTARSQTRRGGGNALMAPAGAGNGNLPRGQRIALLAGLAGLLLFMSFGLRGRRRQLIPALGMLLLLLGLVSCGGGGGGGYTPAPSSGGTGGGSTPTGTPAGTSTLTITATYSATPGGPALVTHTTQVTLTVQ